MTYRVESKLKFRIERIHNKVINIPHVNGPLKPAFTAKKGRIVEYLLPYALCVVFDMKIKGRRLIFRHTETEVRKDHKEVVFVFMEAVELFCYCLSGA
jgi:hypothetical protein